jgi:phosphocarrier protein HPr
MTVKKTFTIKNELGLHARAAGRIVEVANRYKSKIYLERDGRQVDGRSLLGILTLACPRGSKIVFRAEGEDAREALAAFGRLIEDRFGEE